MKSLIAILLIRGSPVQVGAEEQKPPVNGGFFVMYYIYILYSPSSDKYYVGYTNDYNRRLLEHNEGVRTTF